MPISPIVGAHFRPPAKGLLQALPQGTPLQLRPDPDNEYDPGAVAVWYITDQIEIENKLAAEIDLFCSGFGFGLTEIVSCPEWHLGYIPAESNKKDGPSGTAMRRALVGPGPWDCTLTFLPDGRPGVKLES